ncbi:LMBR1-like membrane protein [Ditylenchus destructor]|nr:LMBR1-like membrane protein [Ditylenchus destructor]
MGIGSFVLQLVLVFCLTVFLLNKYGNWRKQHLIVSISTFVGWYFSFLIILVLPLDVSITFFKKCLLEEARLNNATESTVAENISLECEEPKGHVDDSVLLGLWRVVYWTSQLLTWFADF